MQGYYVEDVDATYLKNAKGRLYIDAVNVPEFQKLLEQAEKEACQLNETLGKLRRFEFEIDVTISKTTLA